MGHYTSAANCTSGGVAGATITMLAIGDCTIRANQLGDTTHNAAPQRSLTVVIGGDILFRDGFE